MESRRRELLEELPEEAVFALDIGTRSIIGMVGVPDGDRMQIAAIEKVEHTKRAMIDGQIEDIDQVAGVAGMVKDRLEKKLGCRLTRVAVAAAGRSLRTESVTYEMELPDVQRIDAETVSRLEAGAIGEAEKAFFGGEETERSVRFYLVGYSVSRYYLDDYILSSLIDHNGRVLRADVIATFLPAEVVESLYAAMHKIDLEIASLTLEPIAAINAAIPANIRLLNLALVDIGAGTSDIAVCRDGCVTGYTMAVQAGDEITESIMKEFLVNFSTAEEIKSRLDSAEPIVFTDIMGFEQVASREQLCEGVKPAVDHLCEAICDKILEANGGTPSAVFLAGGGSRFPGLLEGIVERLHMDPKRVAVAGRNFMTSACSEEYDLENPEYATPLGIVISAGLNMINDSFRILLNGRPAKLFRNGIFTTMNILMMNGYGYQDIMGKSGQNLVVFLNGSRRVFYGEKAEPCVLKLNGRDAQLSDMVRAGDQLDFVPVRHGKDASARLSDLIGQEQKGTVTVNGLAVSEDVVLKAGDVIFAEGIRPAAEEKAGEGGAKKTRGRKNAKQPAQEKKRSASAAGRKKNAASDSAQPARKRKQRENVLSEPSEEKGKDAEKPAVSAISPDAADAERKTESPDREEVHTEQEIRPVPEEPVFRPQPVPQKPVSRPVPSEPEEAFDSDGSRPVREKATDSEPIRPAEGNSGFTRSAEESSGASGQPPYPQRSMYSSSGKLLLYLNGKTLVLPPKADGQPYYLMDMLEYSDLELEKVTAPVVLEVNGQSGTFSQELRSGDTVKIYEQSGKR